MTVPRACRFGLVALGLAALAIATSLLAAPSQACACGAAIAPGGSQATVNHEVALVHWDGTTETMLIQLAMNADTSNLALVVPTPTPASVAAGDKATFTELDALTAPQVQHRRHWKLDFGISRSGGARAAAPTAPSVLSQVHLGPLEATTLAGGDLAGLQKWLSDNGYYPQPGVSDALKPYVRDGWSFVAIRLTSSAPIVGGLEPVRLTFAATQLVYPMRLSIAAPNPQQVTIFVLSDHRQQRVDTDASSQAIDIQFAGNVATAMQDPVLRQLSGNHGGYLTKMQMDIPNPTLISSDFAFANATDDNPYHQVLYVDHNITIPMALVVLACMLLAAVAAIVTVIVIAVRQQRRRVTSAGSVP